MKWTFDEINGMSWLNGRKPSAALSFLFHSALQNELMEEKKSAAADAAIEQLHFFSFLHQLRWLKRKEEGKGWLLSLLVGYGRPAGNGSAKERRQQQTTLPQPNSEWIQSIELEWNCGVKDKLVWLEWNNSWIQLDWMNGAPSASAVSGIGFIHSFLLPLRERKEGWKQWKGCLLCLMSWLWASGPSAQLNFISELQSSPPFRHLCLFFNCPGEDRQPYIHSFSLK